MDCKLLILLHFCRSDILSKLKEYNIYKEKMSEHLRHREVNDRIFFEGVLKIYWGLKRPITVAPRKNIGGRKSTFRDSSLNFVSIDDESFGAILENATERFIETMGERDGDGDDDDDDDEEDGKVTQSLSNASLARARESHPHPLSLSFTMFFLSLQASTLYQSTSLDTWNEDRMTTH